MANKDFVVKNSLIVGETATINGVQIDLSNATSGQVLKFDGSKFAPVTLSDGPVSISYEETIGNNSSTSFTITHNLGTKDLNVIVRENTNPYDVVEVAWEATTTNIVTLNFELAPTTSSKRVVIKGPGAKEYYSTLIGDGSSSTIVINHGLGSRNVVPVLKNADSPFEVVDVLSSATSLNSVTFDFSDPPEAESLIASVYLLDLDNSYISTIGDGTNNQFTITHNLNTRDIGIICRSVVSPYDFTSVRWEATTVNTAKVIFSSPPTANSRKIGIYKALGGNKFINDEVTLEMLDDVSITSASNGQFLSWNGTNWVNSNAPGGASINSLDDIPGVTISSPSSNEVLQWNGTAWINASGYATLASPIFTGNVSGITKTMVGLSSVDNTADTAKPVSTAQQTALDLKANIASPTFTGNVSGISATMVGLGNVNNTADTAKPVSTAQQTALDLKANLDSPALTGTPTAPTATAATNTTQIATTAFVRAEVSALVNSAGSTLDTLGEIATALGNDANLSTTLTTSIGLKAPLANPTFTGTVTLPDNTVALGTKTTGDYVASLVAGTGITLSNNSGEGTTPTIAIGQSVATSATPTFASITTTGSNGLIVNYASGDEGGEMLLAKPVTNTSISGTGIVVDVYQNKLRFFEQGGSARGVFIDLTTSGAGVASPIALSQSTGNSTSPVFSNLTVNGSLKITTALEIALVSATAATGTINIDFLSNPVVYYTANATANWTLNIRGNSSTTMNTVMSTGDVATVTFMAQQGATAYYPTVYQIDGTAVTPKWQGGTAPTSGNASSIDTYAVTIVKTAANTYTAFASQTKFA